ncbi:TIR domain-containing protein [Ponticaulis sp.]|uniref:TIR domain-containing protein n=1 Tax=Ponticaulis sp. TaxID=2020902 RepID=UPI002627EF51|nr:TIR domain-containing protein [Ponticaulis sp.]MDF1678933.1 nucleotide-binding protein [Ponticaulis sp.]
MGLLERFSGKRNVSRLKEALVSSRLGLGLEQIASTLIERGDLVSFGSGEALITQGEYTTDVFFIIAGTVEVSVNGRTMAKRGPGQHIGEMAAIEPSQLRSATCVALEEVVALRLGENEFSKTADEYPKMYKVIAAELSRRLLQRNSTVGAYREKSKVFVISSVEGLDVARVIQNAFEHDFAVTVWTDGVFRLAQYPVESLEQAVEDSDFAIAIAQPDDVAEIRGESWPVPRDNIIFELGMFMGKLGRKRAILMEPRGTDVKLPSDLIGIEVVNYNWTNSKEGMSNLGPACNKLREHFKELGPNNG